MSESSEFTAMIHSEPWKALERAKAGAFNAQRVFMRNGFAADFILSARRELAKAENEYRKRWKAMCG